MTGRNHFAEIGHARGIAHGQGDEAVLVIEQKRVHANAIARSRRACDQPLGLRVDRAEIPNRPVGGIGLHALDSVGGPDVFYRAGKGVCKYHHIPAQSPLQLYRFAGMKQAYRKVFGRISRGLELSIRRRGEKLSLIAQQLDFSTLRRESHGLEHPRQKRMKLLILAGLGTVIGHAVLNALYILGLDGSQGVSLDALEKGFGGLSVHRGPYEFSGIEFGDKAAAIGGIATADILSGTNGQVTALRVLCDRPGAILGEVGEGLFEIHGFEDSHQE